MKPFAIILFIAVIIALTIRKIKEIRWRKERAKQTAKLRLNYRNYTAYDTYRIVVCECGHIAEDESWNWIKKRRYYEDYICPCCGRRWKTVEDEDWSW